MSVSELLPAIQSLPRSEKETLYRFLSVELAQPSMSTESLPVEFPPSADGCPATREELEASRREPGLFSLDEIWHSLGAK